MRCPTARLTAGEPPPAERITSARRHRSRVPPQPREVPLRSERFAAEPPDPRKLMVIIATDADADGLVRALVGRGLAATKIGSTGGFLRRGNTTLLCGVRTREVDDVLALVWRLCPARSEMLTLGALPLAGEVSYLAEPVEVRMGGAVVFVLTIDRFERA